MKVFEYILSLKDKLSVGINNASNAVDKLEGKVGKTNGTIGKLAAAAGGLFAVTKVFEFAKDIVLAGANMEQTRVQFETFTGSAKKGNEVIAQLQNFSLATPFDDEQVLKAGKSLLAFGVGTDELQSKLTQIGNISSATGKDFNELTTIYGKAKTAGTLYAEDINQLVEAGVPIIGEFAKQLGVPTSQVKKLASQGKISFDMLEKGFDSLGGKTGKWGALMDKQSKTLAGRWSSVVGTVQNLMSSLGEGQIPFIGIIVDKMAEVLMWVKNNKEKLAQLFIPLQDAVQPLFTALGKVYDSLGLTGSAGDVLNKVFEYVGYTIQLISPFIQTAATIIGKLYESVAKVITVFVEWIKKNKELQTNVIVMYNVLKTAFGAIGDIAGKVFGGIATVIDGIINKDFSKIGKGLKDIVVTPLEVAFNKDTYKDLNDKAPKLTNLFAPTTAATAARDSAKGTKDSLTKPGATGAATGKKNDIKTKVGDVAGTKPVTVNVTINKLVGAENINTTNLKQSVGDVERMLKEMLLAGVSDFTLLAPKN